MSFEDHDYILSLTSHLPHAVAYSIVKTAINNEDKFKDKAISMINITCTGDEKLSEELINFFNQYNRNFLFKKKKLIMLILVPVCMIKLMLMWEIMFIICFSKDMSQISRTNWRI